MYYAESLNLINKDLNRKSLYGVLDRELAHSYNVSGQGWIDLPILTARAHSSAAEIEHCMREYALLGVARRFIPVTCSCGNIFNPTVTNCADCARPTSSCVPVSYPAFEINKQPALGPPYLPMTSGTRYDIFISYRQNDCSKLASDLYYSLELRGLKVFLDTGVIPVNADPATVYLKAASMTPIVISLVSETYYDSDACKLELAHAFRSQRRVIRINMSTTPCVPADMPWLAVPNWHRINGDKERLTFELEESLLSVLQTPTASPNADFRREACQYLLSKKTNNDINILWSRLSYLHGISPSNRLAENVLTIINETSAENLPLLCNSLQP